MVASQQVIQFFRGTNIIQKTQCLVVKLSSRGVLRGKSRAGETNVPGETQNRSREGPWEQQQSSVEVSEERE